MNSRSIILQSVDKFLIKRDGFSYRVSKLISEGEFNGVLSSHDLVHLINEGPGRNIKVTALTALMQPLQSANIVRVLTVGKGGNKRKFWYPAWIKREDAVRSLSNQPEASRVLFFTGKESWTDPNKNFPKIIQELKGTLDIVDPYYGNGTFYTLEKFGKKTSIRFLTCNLGSAEKKASTKFTHNLQKFRREFKNIKMRIYDKAYEIHDRYIIADNGIVIIGHGLKDLANKESFVVFLSKDVVKGFLNDLKKTFEKRWNKSKNLV